MESLSITAPAGATALTTTDDSEIIAAWERFASSRKAVGELPDETPGYHEQEERLWNIVGEAEAYIGKSMAKTPTGVEVQLWCIVSHDVPQWEWELAVFRRDIAYFDDIDDQLDWSTRLALQAIRSLRVIGGAA